MSTTFHHRVDTGRAFDHVVMHAAPGVHERAMELLRDQVMPGATVADFGAGSGAFSRRLQSAGFQPTAVEFEPEGIPADLPTVAADLCQDVPLPDNVFDAVASIEVIEHVDCPLGMLRTALRVLRPGGFLLVTTPNVLHPYSRLKFLARGRMWHFDERAYDAGHSTPIPAWLMRQHLQRVGFADIRVGYAGAFTMKPTKQAVVATLSRLYRPADAELGVRDQATTILVSARKPGARQRHHSEVERP